MPKDREDSKVYADDINNLAFKKTRSLETRITHDLTHIIKRHYAFIFRSKIMLMLFVLKVLCSHGYLYTIFHNIVRCLNCQKSISSVL